MQNRINSTNDYWKVQVQLPKGKEKKILDAKHNSSDSKLKRTIIGRDLKAKL